MGDEPAIVAGNLVTSFGDRGGVDDVSFSVSAGETCALLGRDGAGKTTTMRMLLGLLRPPVVARVCSESVRIEDGRIAEIVDLGDVSLSRSSG